MQLDASTISSAGARCADGYNAFGTMHERRFASFAAKHDRTLPVASDPVSPAQGLAGLGPAPEGRDAPRALTIFLSCRSRTVQNTSLSLTPLVPLRRHRLPRSRCFSSHTLCIGVQVSLSACVASREEAEGSEDRACAIRPFTLHVSDGLLPRPLGYNFNSLQRNRCAMLP